VDDNAHQGIPLLGALLLEQRLITLEQLHVCLQLQSEQYLGISIGQILVNCGYISASDLAHILILQNEIKASLMTSVGTRLEPPADFSALLVYRHRVPQLTAMLQHLGVAAQSVNSWTELTSTWAPVDLILIDPGLLDSTTDLSSYASVPIIPLAPLPGSPQGIASFPPWADTMLMRVIAHLQAQRQEQSERTILRERAADLAVFSIMNRFVSAKSPPQQMLSQIVIQIRDHIQAEAGVLYRLDHDSQSLVPEVAFGPPPASLPVERIGLREGVAGWVARRRKPLVLADVSADPRFDAHVDQPPGMKTRAIICIPLIAHGTVVGVIKLLNKVGATSFTPEDLAFLRLGAPLVGLILAMGTEALVG
jgi:putative methionine-R-sulfoxide reductase with GAF domain